MTDEYDADEAGRLLTELNRMLAELEALRSVSVGLRGARPYQIDDYLERVRAIKADIKEAARHGTLDRKRREKTRLEQVFFDPAVRHASANFRMRANAAPSNWQSGLGDPAFELSYCIDNLERYVAEMKSSSA